MSKQTKKGKPKSAGSLSAVKTGRQGSTTKQQREIPPLDMLQLKILSLRIQEEEPPYYAIKVAFCDQLLISAIIKPLGVKDKSDRDSILAKGTMTYDPSDYEKMCAFANQPLVVHIQPLKNVMTDWMNAPVSTPTISQDPPPPQGKGNLSQRSQQSPRQPEKNLSSMRDISSCNIDILPMFLDTEKMCIKKRMQPMVPTKVLYKISWDNLPLLTMGITAVRNEENSRHHRMLEDANWMKLTVVGAYNLLVPFDADCFYTAASKMPVHNDQQTQTVAFCRGHKMPNRFQSISFFPKWESLRALESLFCNADDKLNYDIESIYNPEDLNLHYYLRDSYSPFTTIWGSFHRSLLMGNAPRWHWKYLRNWSWPVEVHVYGDIIGGFSFMGFLDLFPLLYPGVSKLLIAVPLHWYSPQLMMEKSNCTVLMLPNEKASNTPATPRPTKTTAADSTVTGTSTETGGFLRATGADDSCAFVLVEVQFSRPLVQEQIPPYISKRELSDMLNEMESGQEKRACTGRGQRPQDWRSTVRAAANSLRRVPHHGLTEFCNFNRQLSETRTRVELMTSFWTDAAIFVNNNFTVQQYLESDEHFEELLLMSHVCLMKIACETLIGPTDPHAIDETLRAARHARQLNDIPHALELYLQMAVSKPFESDNWRELSTCLKDVDRSWAEVCLTKALLLDIRHPLTLLSKGCMVFDEDPDAAEPFFMSVLLSFPFWPTGYMIAIAYFTKREYFRLADEILKALKDIQEQRLNHDLPLPRAWEKELGDFWESTLLLPGMSPFYDAADLLLRLRGIQLAEVCLGLALAETGESAAYFHLVALCYRLRGDLEPAICLVRKAMEKFGQNTYLKCMEAECLHEMEDVEGSVSAFEKVSGGTNPYSILLSLPCWEASRVRTVLVDLLRRQPSAYGWMALANDWLLKVQLEDSSLTQLTDEETAALTCAAACAVQALKWDRRAGRAWATLAKLVKPNKRRVHCTNMAIDCGFVWDDEDVKDLRTRSQESVCHRLGYTFKECRCSMCEPIKF